MAQASTHLPRFHSSGTNLCSLSDSPCVDYVAMIFKCTLKGGDTYRLRALTFATPICSVIFLGSVDK